MRKGFTLIEVMISVVIISSVIVALLEMYSNNTHIFSVIDKKVKINQYATFFLANHEVGFEKDEVWLIDLVDGFDLEEDLRRKLKNIKAKILYQKLETIDLADFEEDTTQEDGEEETQDKEVKSTMVFEVGKTILQAQQSSVGYLRLQLK